MTPNTFFTSDLHFFHKNIMTFCPPRAARWPSAELEPDRNDKGEITRRRFDISVMNEGLIERWNSVVKPGDTVWQLGDFSFGKPAETINVLRRLNGNIHGIHGNHDNVIHDNADVRACFASLQDYKEIKGPDKLKIVLFHFPIHVWHKNHHNSIHLHGHCHNSIPWEGRRADVGIDSTHITGVAEHRPFSMEEVVAAMKNRTKVIHDHHDGYRE